MLSNKKRVTFIGGVRYDVSAGMPAGFALNGTKHHTHLFDTGYGGSVTRAAKIAAKNGALQITLMAKGSADPTGRIFAEKMKMAGVDYRPLPVAKFPMTLCVLHGHDRDNILCDDKDPRDDENEWTDICPPDLADCDGLYIDGRLPHQALAAAKEVSGRCFMLLDGCAGRINTEEILRCKPDAIVSELLCQERGLRPLEMLDHLRACGCEVGAVTLGEYGVIWYEKGSETQYLPALVPPRVISTNGAGDAFHGGYFVSKVLQPELPTLQHLIAARAAATHAIQHLSNDIRIPRPIDIDEASRLPESSVRPEWLH